ncbi:hypothetical protein AUJ83_00490 [Candidatus Woesearchaeota archaeon CG1_02_33_12]|nr:MAG: hypothetical protein AUJ83_00490 [Candidatus Woesearchaeota archaeon CG1_02_33_12]PIN79253.1 MAG: hypothetical protein COV14_00515 [Candidatus Woesearchaeota archaeon CG10_big_fil_rev_8_21_14_0_10_33_12]
MKNLTKFGIVALLLVSLAGSVFAFSGRGFGNEETRQAIESGDYETWKEAMTSQLTEERFNQMKENHNQMAEKKAGMQEQRESVEAAIEAEDYDAWVLAVETCPRENKFAETVTEENFKTFVAMHNAMQDKDFETAKALAEELGLEKPEGKMGGRFGHRMHNMPSE